MSSPGSGARRASAVFLLLSSFVCIASARTFKSEDWADAHFAAAGKLHDVLNSRPESQRTRSQYQRVIDAYRSIYLNAPSSGKADPSVAATADLMTEMGRRFDDEKILRSAIKQYEFLRREYPGSKSRVAALFSIGQIYQDDLGETEQAQQTFQDFVHRYPHSAQTTDARQALKEIAEAVQDKKAAPAKKIESAAIQEEDRRTDAKPSDSDEASPSRVGADKIASINGIHYSVTDGGAQVIIDLDHAVKYDAQRLDHPDRIFFNLFDAKIATSRLGKEIKADGSPVKAIRASEFKPGQARIVLDVENDVEFKAAFSAKGPHLIVDLRKTPVTAQTDAQKVTGGMATTDDALLKKTALTRNDAKNPDEDAVADKRTAKKPVVARKKAYEVREAKPTADGDRSLIRALGLKIGRIVIDPGHGGHDTGTIGPHGLLEKDLVLDVSKRLGRLLEARLHADVIYTRSDDTFIPLETRTAIANQEEADLFISVHANSSEDEDARGVETYYLNFTSSPEALEVAARENAGSEKSIHELQDLVKTIALREKIEESREFASDVETALHSGLSAKNPAIRDRGVKKAPFIVLIGANMPSILAEISFVSNPADERKLRTAAYRQRIAESLYRGISKYVGGLSGIRVASTAEHDHQR
jgi:N-acetylmuramoyl-L-alanine amidase